MKFYTIPPPPRLSNFVRFFWVLESHGPIYIHRSMADVCPEMVFHYKGQFDELLKGDTEKSAISSLQGPSSQIRRFKIEKEFGIFGVYLYPYSIPHFFGLPTTELSNQMPDLITLLGKSGAELEECMMLAPDNSERIKIITAFLEARLKKNKQHHAVLSAIQYMILSKQRVKIEQIANQYFISQRQFERKFKEFSGFAPKLFSRIVRFHEACKEFGDPHKSLTDIAHGCGYYDQSHFIHEFKEFSGYNPTLYFSGKSEGTEWKRD